VGLMCRKPFERRGADQGELMETRGIRAHLAKRGWPVAATPARVLAYLFAVEIAAAVVAGISIARLHSGLKDFALAAFMLVTAVAFEEGVRRAARVQMRLSSDLKRDMTSVWTVSTAVALPAGYAAVVIAVLAGYIWVRQHRPAGHPLHRGIFNVAEFVLAASCANVVVHVTEPSWRNLPWALGVAVAVVLAMTVYTVVNRLLASVALLLLGVPLRELRGSRHDNLIEFATLCLGGLVAVAALYEPWVCVLALAPMVTLQRGALVRELETAATVDAKTGLLNALAWEHLTQRELARAVRER